MKDYIIKILVPYLSEKRQQLGLSVRHRALVIYNKFRAQCTPAILALLEENDIDIVTVPANCTDRLQPLDVSVNKAAKDFLRDKFHKWYAEQIQKQMSDDILVKEPVDLRLSITHCS
uniref:DDE-1 domain-containing protein n=1 Tax=Amphimedon queenslandica TaxID=400682 RepID=A0A1X7V5T4_AMPQE